MIVLSLFDGISVGRLALDRTGIPVTAYYASEIDKYAISVSETHYPDIIRLGDIRGWREWNIPTPDLIIGGSPCQDLSSAGKRAGLQGERSGLFYVFVDILRHYKPKYFLLENVASMSKENKAIITSEMGVEPIMIDSALVSAQSRKRLYWTNIQGITQPEDKKIYLHSVLGIEADTSKLCDKPVLIGHVGKDYAQANRIYSVYGKSVCLKGAAGGLGGKTGLYDINSCIRKLTPSECEELQTLPLGYTEGVSNNQRYKMIGNAWTADVIAHIFSFIKES